MTKWRKGPPPSIGWWPASAYEDPGALRFYNGRHWSDVAYDGYDIEQVKVAAITPARNSRNIKWTDRPADWPERSRT